MTKKRRYLDTTVALAPLTVDEALSALLKTPPPPAVDKSKLKTVKQRKRVARKL
jgi:hypothetical protein